MKIHLPLIPLDHELHGLGPASDHLVRSKRCGVSPVVTAIELCSSWEYLIASLPCVGEYDICLHTTDGATTPFQRTNIVDTQAVSSAFKYEEKPN